jgi:hypothetical protein
MSSTAIQKLDPRYSMYLKGFDRRGAAGALTAATANSFQVSGNWADQVDFVVLMIVDADDLYGHLYTTKYLPDFSLTDVVLDYDLALTEVYAPTSVKFDSLQAGQLSYITAAGVSGATPLAPLVTSASGGSTASVQVSINNTNTNASASFTLGCFGNFYITSTGYTAPADIAGNFEYQVNNAMYDFWGLAMVPLFIADIVLGSYTNQFVICAGRSAFANTLGATQPPTQFSFAGAVMTITQANLVGTLGGGGTYDYRSLVGFWGVKPGDYVLVLLAAGGPYERHTVSSVTSPWEITLDSAPASSPVMVVWPLYAQDGNTFQFWLNTNSPSSTFTAGPNTGTNLYPKLAGGAELTTFHVHVDFTALGIDSLRQAWFTFGPLLNIDATNDDATIQPFATINWSAIFSNWTVTDPSTHRPLKIAGPGSQLVDSNDSWANFLGGWTVTAGSYHFGYAKVRAYTSVTPGVIIVKYVCPHTHDLYLGTSLYGDRGQFSVSLDGTALSDVDMYLNTGTAVQTRRVLTTGVAAGAHVVIFTVLSTSNASSTGTNCYFDYLQAVVASDVQAPAVTYPNLGAAFDFDTDQTYKLSPYRALFIVMQAGFLGDIDFYGGVFFALKRVRYGGSFHAATVTLGGSVVANDSFFIDIGGTTIGVAVSAFDTLTSLAQRAINAINLTFVGVYAAPTVTAGQFTITVLSPINGFTLTETAGTSITVTVTGDIGVSINSIETGGQEGTWQVDSTQTSPLNSAFVAYLADLCAQLVANSMTCTVAWSQELLNPPDVNTSAGAWSQRFASGVTVLTSTGFGSWGAGYVEAVVVAGSTVTITQTAHGYVTGFLAQFGARAGVFPIVVVDANTYTLDLTNQGIVRDGTVATASTTISRISGSYFPSTITKIIVGSVVYDVTYVNSFTLTASTTVGTNASIGFNFVPAVDDSITAALQTTQCAFNLATTVAYLAYVYVQTAEIMNAAGLVPWLQFGEMGHWFFSQFMTTVISAFSNSSGLIEVTTAVPHGLTGSIAILAGTGIIDGTHAVTVVDSTHFTVNSSTWPGGTPTVQGTVSGGGMAYYDANQAAAATTALGRSLASFYTQDDDPTINSSADANFLAGRVKAQTDAIVAAVLAVYSGAMFEVLWPYDVNFSYCYYTSEFPYPQGGRLNRAVNLPSGWTAKSGSNLNRFKIEGLSWGETYRNVDNAKKTAQYPYLGISWTEVEMRYLIPWDNGGCPWKSEYVFNVRVKTPFLNLWAFDHFILFSWQLPMPVAQNFVQAHRYKMR